LTPRPLDPHNGFDVAIAALEEAGAAARRARHVMGHAVEAMAHQMEAMATTVARAGSRRSRGRDA